MTTPDDTTPTTETTNRTTTTTSATDLTQTTAETSRSPIPDRIPITEEAGPPLVPPIRTASERQAETEPTDGPSDADRRPSPPPADDERDAPLVPDLRLICRPRTDGGSQ